jgi:endonuclease I
MQRRSLKYPFLFLWYASATLVCSAQPPGYYSSANGLTGTALQQVLHDIIDNHTVVEYSSLWTHFQSTDKNSDGKVWDMYSDIPGGTPAYTYIFVTGQCGSYSKEGDCYNREHSFPNSWFGDEVYPMYTDLFHLYPTDGYVNNKRGNYPFGVTNTAGWTSMNGSKLGPSSYSGYSGTVFEPVRGYKGDFARTYFYMAVRYYGEDSGWPGSDMVTGSQLKPWALKMMMEWDIADPVSQKEKDRNEAVYLIQGNRNPFIDNPLYSGLIWGTQSGTEELPELKTLKIWPNPAQETVTIESPHAFSDLWDLRLLDASGRVILSKSVSGQPVTLDVAPVKTGYYILLIKCNNEYLFTPLIVSH